MIHFARPLTDFFLLSLVQEAFWQFISLNKVEKISYFEGNKVKKEYLQQKEELNEKGTFNCSSFTLKLPRL